MQAFFFFFEQQIQIVGSLWQGLDLDQQDRLSGMDSDQNNPHQDKHSLL